MAWTAEEYLEHSAKGTTWSKKDHKYIKKVNGVYYYKEDIPHFEQYEKYSNLYNQAEKRYNDVELERRQNMNKANFHFNSADSIRRITGDTFAEEANYHKREGEKYGAAVNANVREQENLNKQGQTYANIANRNARAIEYNDEHRKFAARAEMKLAEIGDKIKAAGEAFLKKLGLK